MERTFFDRLAGRMLIEEFRDWDKNRERDQIVDFLNSDDYFPIAEQAGFDKKEAIRIRSKLLSGDYDRKLLHAVYA